MVVGYFGSWEALSWPFQCIEVSDRYTVIKRWPLVEGSSVVLRNMVFSRSVNAYAACVEMYGMSARWKSKS